MIIQTLIALFFLFILIDANPIHPKIRQYEERQRRNLIFSNWESPDTLDKDLYEHENENLQKDRRYKRSEIAEEIRPVKGPMNIEHISAMLAARYVKRYPYSQQDDPAIIGR